MSRHERWQSAGVWLNELGPAAELQQIFVEVNPIRKGKEAGAKNKVPALF